MDTRDKLLLDRLVATPLAFGLTGAAWVLGRVLRRDHSVRADGVRTIVVAKLLGMGSIIQATPFLHALKRGFPQARLVFLTGIANRALVDRLPMVDEAIYLRDTGLETLAADSIAALVTLARGGVDLYFDLEVYSAGASVLALMTFSRNRYGFYRHSARFKKGNYTHLVFFNPRMPVARLYLQLYEAARRHTDADVTVDPSEFGPITVTSEDVAAMRAKMGELGLPANVPYLVVNPNASDLLLERRWPAERFARAIVALTARGHRVVLIGAPGEAAYVGELYERLPPAARARTIDVAGKISLVNVFALIREARCVITNDTGPMHLAIAMKRPTVCLFGPGSPDHYGVHRQDVEILYKSVLCSPCIYETDVPPCDGNNVCMQLIEPEEVVDATLRLLGESTAGPARTSYVPLPGNRVRYVDLRGRALGVVARASIREDEAE